MFLNLIQKHVSKQLQFLFLYQTKMSICCFLILFFLILEFFNVLCGKNHCSLNQKMYLHYLNKLWIEDQLQDRYSSRLWNKAENKTKPLPFWCMLFEETIKIIRKQTYNEEKPNRVRRKLCAEYWKVGRKEDSLLDKVIKEGFTHQATFEQKDLKVFSERTSPNREVGENIPGQKNKCTSLEAGLCLCAGGTARR